MNKQLSVETRLILAAGAGVLGTAGIAAFAVSFLGGVVLCGFAGWAGYMAWHGEHL